MRQFRELWYSLIWDLSYNHTLVVQQCMSLASEEQLGLLISVTNYVFSPLKCLSKKISESSDLIKNDEVGQKVYTKLQRKYATLEEIPEWLKQQESRTLSYQTGTSSWNAGHPQKRNKAAANNSKVQAKKGCRIFKNSKKNGQYYCKSGRDYNSYNSRNNSNGQTRATHLKGTLDDALPANGNGMVNRQSVDVTNIGVNRASSINNQDEENYNGVPFYGNSLQVNNTMGFIQPNSGYYMQQPQLFSNEMYNGYYGYPHNQNFH